MGRHQRNETEMTTLEMIDQQIHPAVGEWELPEFVAESALPSRDGDRVIQFREALREAMSETGR